MTAKQAQTLTKLDTRENPDAHNEYLRCLLGREESVPVQTSAFRTVPQTVFRLVAFGRDWENAVEMWEKKMKAKATT